MHGPTVGDSCSSLSTIMFTMDSSDLNLFATIALLSQTFQYTLTIEVLGTFNILQTYADSTQLFTIKALQSKCPFPGHCGTVEGKDRGQSRAIMD